MKHCVLFSILILSMCACRPKPSCTTNSIRYVELDEMVPAKAQEAKSSIVSIQGVDTQVDRVVHGQLCGQSLDGTVYVACDLELVQWEQEPLFLQNCDFQVEDGTIIYVAPHNDTPFYKGCSCHTGTSE